MHSDDFPVQGCFCCDTYEPIADKTHNFSIFQTCIDDTSSTSTYQKCFNEVNLNQHNALRKKHETPDLHTDRALAESAAKRAEVLAGLGSLSPDTDFLETDDGKLCGESLIKFDAKTAPGLTAINWQYGTLATDYFYKGSIDYDPDNHEVTGSRGYQYASLLWKSSVRVGFGYYGQYVVARYCAKKDSKIEDTPYPKPPEKGLTAYALNVCPENGCAKCPTPVKGLGYDNCYNARALKYVNNLRKMVG